MSLPMKTEFNSERGSRVNTHKLLDQFQVRKRPGEPYNELAHKSWNSIGGLSTDMWKLLVESEVRNRCKFTKVWPRDCQALVEKNAPKYSTIQRLWITVSFLFLQSMTMNKSRLESLIMSSPTKFNVNPICYLAVNVQILFDQSEVNK